jgi:hypothetical protein
VLLCHPDDPTHTFVQYDHIFVPMNQMIFVCFFKTFLIEDFLHLPPVSLTPVANLELRISPRIFEKIRNDPNGILRGLGETDS